MKHRRNIAVAAVTAVVVTTALVGTTLPDLVADRSSDATTEQSDDDQSLAETFVVTDLPDTPSADEISTAKESDQAREQLIADIAGRIDQASERANELEAELQRQQSLATARMEEAAEAAEAAEQATLEAETALAMDASAEYQEEDTSAADVLLGEEDTLAEDATDQQLEEQAEQEAVDAEQAAREAEAERERAEAAAQETADSLADAGEATADNSVSRDELGANLREQLEALMELEGWEGDFQSFLENTLGNTDFIDENGEIDEQQLVYRVQQLRADAEQTQVAAAEEAEDEVEEPAESEEPAEPAESEEASADADGEAASAEAAETDEAGFDSLDTEQQELLASGAEAEGIESARDYYEMVRDNSNFTTSGGAVDWDVIANHVSYLESQEEAEPEAGEEPAETPSPTATPSPTSTPTSSPSPSSSPSASESSAASFDSLSSDQRELLAETGELEGIGSASEYYQLVLDNSHLTTSSGAVNWTVLEGHLSYLQAQEAAEEAEAAPSPTATSTPTPSSTPSPTQTSTPTPTPTPTPTSTPTPSIPSWSDLGSGLQDLLNSGAQLEPGFDGTGGDYYRAVLTNPDLTTGDGRVSQNALQWHVSHLESQNQSQPTASATPTPTPTQTQSSTPTPTPTQTQTSNPEPAGGGGGSSAQIAINWAVDTANRSGTFYQLGANGPDAWDCSSFVQAAFAQAGVNLGRTTYSQITQGREVSWGDRQPGDLIFWGDYHVAIYLGNGRMVDAGSPSAGVSVRSVFGSPSSVRRVG